MLQKLKNKTLKTPGFHNVKMFWREAVVINIMTGTRRQKGAKMHVISNTKMISDIQDQYIFSHG